MRRQLETPCAPQHEIDDNRAVVHFFTVEVRVPAEAPGVFGVVAVRGRGEEGEVPVLGDIPIEGVEGVEEDEEEP